MYVINENRIYDTDRNVEIIFGDNQSFWNELKTKSYEIIKRTFDLVVSLFGIIAIVLLAIPIKISYVLSGDKSSIFYSQKRIGKNGEEYKMYKFRTMVPNADEVLKEVLKNPEYKKQWEKHQKLDNDPRITKFGKFLRNTSLDEIPQFLNVANNSMSLIGPRPLVPGELDAHNGNHNIYESVQPGITSWWASHGRSNLAYDERLDLEYYYVINRSLLLDVKCFIDTVKCVVMKDGAK